MQEQIHIETLIKEVEELYERLLDDRYALYNNSTSSTIAFCICVARCSIKYNGLLNDPSVGGTATLP